MNDLPNFFTDKKELLTYDYSFDHYLDSECDESFFIDNLSPSTNKKELCENFLKSILLGYNHIFVSKLLEDQTPNSNICLPIIHQWENDEVKINNLILINHPDDAERICKKHIKKVPNLKSLLKTSIISTTDNDEWKTQRNNMNIAFLPSLSLKEIFPISQERAQQCSHLLIQLSDNYSKSIDMSGS